MKHPSAVRGGPSGRLPLIDVLRLGRPAEIWYKHAVSVVVATAPPSLLLVALGRLDLAVYTTAGSLCALYAHNRPYSARARALAGVIAGMVAGLAVALTAASLTSSGVALVAVGAVLAALHKALCDAAGVGPPGSVILTFVSSAALFAPQTLGQVPGHVGLALAAGGFSWLVGMAPGLLRPHGPERRAVVQALRRVAAHAESAHRAEPDGEAAAQRRADAAGALHNAWQTLLTTGRRSSSRRPLGRALVRAEAVLAAPAPGDAAELRDLADRLRGLARVPDTFGPALDGEDEDELLGVEMERAFRAPSLRHRLVPLRAVALRTLLGCALAGWASLALGIGRPYWALVTAASLFQANLSLTWNRSVQRVVGNLAGVAVFAVLAPVAHLSPWTLVLTVLALSFGAEALISRNYWLGSLCVTPMALLVTEYAHLQDTPGLVVERTVDTLVGALVGLVAAVAVTDRRAADRVAAALGRARAARQRTEALLSGPFAGPGALAAARRELAAELVGLRGTVQAASGEWWLRALPTEDVMREERAGHRTLAATVRHPRPGPAAVTRPSHHPSATTEDATS
ncbi:FUSC family protein [Streptomyces chilikensis]|uniref:FUSC family protein n=1 Tax=Streptomyces chilikensis TaxID=1194079 RepID=UPI00140DE4B7|nr:FUSC family protein [Streptomyces chilikensis]